MVTKLVPFLVGMFVLDIVLELGQEDMYSLVLELDMVIILVLVQVGKVCMVPMLVFLQDN
jgi:hypothetical protein